MRRELHTFLRFLAVATLGLSACLEAATYVLPEAGDSIVGRVRQVQASADDTFVDLARRHGLGYTDLKRANPGVDPWLPGEGTVITLPTRFVLPDVPREGVVLNLAEYRMYYFPATVDGVAREVHTFPISIGRMDWETPLGRTRVVSKAEQPNWYPPQSIREEHAEAGDPLPRVVPPGPDNPLGEHALRLGLPGYLIHGTNRPAGVGMRVTHGCIRMFPEDVAAVFAMVPVGTPVRIVNQPVKFGWRNDELFMEAHQVLASAPEPEVPGAAAVGQAAEPGARESAVPETALAEPVESDLTLMTRAYVAATGARDATVDWDRLEAIFARASGIPVAVGRAALAVRSAADATSGQSTGR